jgi:hypothetical protein
MTRSARLRELAAWYWEFAEKTGNPQIWAARLQHAEILEAEAVLLSPDPAAEADEDPPGRTPKTGWSRTSQCPG